VNSRKNQIADQFIGDELRKMADVTMPDSLDLRIRTMIHDEIQSKTEIRDLMDIEETARFFNVSVMDIIQILDELPSFEIAGRIRFRRIQLEKWIESRENIHGWQKRQSELKIIQKPLKYSGG